MRGRNLFEILMRSKTAFLCGALIPAIYTLFFFNFTLISFLYLISTELLLLHVIYGGYVVFRDHEKHLPFYSGIGLIVWALVITILPMNINNPPYWFLSLLIIFIFALVYHWSARATTLNKNLKKLCAIKMKLEIRGILFSVICLFLSIKLGFDLILAWVNLVAIILTNVDLLFKTKVYKD